MNLKKQLKCLIAIILMIATLIQPISEVIITHADVTDNGTGSGNQGVSSGGQFTWDVPRQGYRVTIVDEEGEVVADPVDLVFSDVPSNAIGYYTCKVEEFGSRTTKNERYPISKIIASKGFGKDMPVPISSHNNVLKGEGVELNKWLMAGECNLSSTIKGSSGSSSSSGGKLT